METALLMRYLRIKKVQYSFELFVFSVLSVYIAYYFRFVHPDSKLVVLSSVCCLSIGPVYLRVHKGIWSKKSLGVCFDEFSESLTWYIGATITGIIGLYLYSTKFHTVWGGF